MRTLPWLVEIEQIPIVNVDKYLNYIEFLFINYRKYDTMIECYDNNIVSIFIEKVYNDGFYSDIKDKISKKFDYLIAANNFDLI